MDKILSWIPGWLGFLALILIGTAMAIVGIANPFGADHTNRVGFAVFGVTALLIGAISWIVGGTSKIKGREGTVGVKVAVQDMPWYGWVIDVAILVAGIVLFLVLTRA